MKKKDRLDQLLVNLELFPSRESARTAIMDGGILVDGCKSTKPGQATNCDAKIEVVASYQRCPYVSRGGLKLEKALSHFAISAENRVCVDAGASTGGFTDCLLKNGAAFVYAIDVGYGQIDWSLRTDERVATIERTNIRHLKKDELYKDRAPELSSPDLAVADLSFISVTKILAPLASLLSPQCELVILIKPQFEAGREKVGKGGVVREPATHIEVIENVVAFAATLGLQAQGLTFSPVKGPSGNIEYLLWLKANGTGNEGSSINATTAVTEAFSSL